MLTIASNAFAQNAEAIGAASELGFESDSLILITVSIAIFVILSFAYFLRKKNAARPLPKLPASEVSTVKKEEIRANVSVAKPTSLETGLDQIREDLSSRRSTEVAQPIQQALEEDEEILAIKRDDALSWLQRLKLGLSKTRSQLQDNLKRLFGSASRLDDNLLEDIHEILYRADLGVDAADHMVQALRKRFISHADKPSWAEVVGVLREEVSSILSVEDRPLNFPGSGPFVILVVGVNGVGKTTSIGKLAARFVSQGKTVMLGAADTFRAAAIGQLQVWGDRMRVPVVKHQQGADPASVAFDAVKAAKARGIDVLLIDTAGRLHSKQELMEELAKIKRVISKELPEAPHETWLVIDATNGQNAVQQVKAFQEIVSLTGLIVTKLDGTAKGGVIVGIKKKFGIPIRFVGVGEKAADLREFAASDFAQSMFSEA